MFLKFLYKLQKYEEKKILINKKELTAIISDSFIKHMIGLMFRESLDKKSCMLFIFNRNAHHGVWMHNMRFPIDVIWLNEEMRLEDFVENIQPCKTLNCKTYTPKKMVKYIIELNSGFIGSNKINKNSKFALR